MATEFISPVKEGLTFVEFGCGRGAGTVYLSELLKTDQANGTDNNESLIQYCAKQYRFNNLGKEMNWCILDVKQF